MTSRVRPRPLGAAVLALVATAGWLSAQETSGADPGAVAPPPAAQTAPVASVYETTTVTATGNRADPFPIAAPVIVIGAQRIEELQPDNAAELLLDQPGVDVNGVGANQPRPIIRGQRGLRVLFLENGLRLNNARRQTDFGEITGLVDTSVIETVEVVRGPASVLYGSDAIGGVMNLITRVPRAGDGSDLQAQLALRYSTADEQQKVSAGVSGFAGKLAYALTAAVRDAEDYEAAAGSFGAISLAEDTPVLDTGVEDDSWSGYLGYQPRDDQAWFVRASRYRADLTGFGLVEPELIGDPSAFRIRITYPFQDFDRYSLGWQSAGFAGAANTADVQAYWQNNERELANDIAIDIGPVFGPGPRSDVQADTLNFTDLSTLGLRAELTRTLGAENLLTYGADYAVDDSNNTDRSVTVTTLRARFPLTFICGPAGAVPPPPFQCVLRETDDVANAPNATNRQYGVFVQDEWRATDRFTASLGLRYADVATEADTTPGWDVAGLDFDDEAVVGAFNLTYRVHHNVNLIASYATAFRAPNIIERLFNGLTPEGAGFQILNPALESETSDNLDLGVKVRTRRAFLEAIVFDSEVDVAIIQHTLSAAEIAALPPEVQDEIDQAGVQFVVQQRNADVLKIEGVEVSGGYRFANGLSLGGSYTHLSGQSETGGAAADPTGDTFSEKITGFVRYDSAQGRYAVEYRVRRNGEEDVQLDPGAEPGPLGEVLPAFTVHSVLASVRLHENDRWRHGLLVGVDNLTDELYSEFSNASFFRPQPKRSVTASYQLRIK